MLVDVAYAPGTQKAPQQTKLSELTFTDTNGVHFPNGRLSTLPAYNTVTNSYGSVTLTGAVRADHALQISGTYAGFYELYGAHKRLYARLNNVLYNITPFATASTALINNPYYAAYDNAQTTPFHMVSGSKLLGLLTFVSAYLALGDQVTVSGVAAPVNGIPAADINGTHTIVAFDGTYFQIQVNTASNASGFPAVAGNALQFKKVVIHHVAHGFVDGDRVKITGAAGTVGGIVAAEINGEHIVTTGGDPDFYGFATTMAATSFATGGGAAVLEFHGIAAGNIDQGAASGIGCGIIGKGIIGIGGPPVSAQSFPRIWSFGNFGNQVVMCPGDYVAGDGQKIYIWDGNTAIAPTVLTNAPTDCNWVSVVNNSVVALCGTRTDICQLGNATVWSGLSFYSVTQQKEWKLIACHNRGEKDAVIFTPSSAYLLEYVGGQDLWDISELYLDDGLLSPYSASLIGTTMRWRGYRGSYTYDGSPPKKDYNAQNEQWIINNTNYSKSWKSFAFTDSQNGQWYHYFPTGTDSEPGDYAIYNSNSGNLHVTLGRMTRTAAQRPGFINSQFAMINASSASTAGTIYRHFINGPVTFSWSATTALFYVDIGEYRFLIDKFLPDSTQDGAFNIQMISQPYPQGMQTISSVYPISATTAIQSVKAGGRVFGIIFSGTQAATIGAWKMHCKQLGKR